MAEEELRILPAIRQLKNREEEYKQLITEFIEEEVGILVSWWIIS